MTVRYTRIEFVKDSINDKVMKRKNPIVEQIKKEVSKEDGGKKPLLLIPTGSTLLNLACSDTIEGGWAVGKMVNLIGDSSSGKSMLAFTMFAEVVRRSEFSHYRLIYDDVEQACEFNMGKLFGSEVVKRVEPPEINEDGEPKYSDVIQDFYASVLQLCKDGRPFIYVLDSLDALSSKEEVSKVEEVMTAHKEGKQVSGTYGMDKVKMLTQILRIIVGKVKDTASFILIISQTRDNISPLSYETKTRSGGRALRFYSSHEIWLTMAKKHKSKDRVIGAEIKAKVSKNKLTGKLREIGFSMYYDLGLDNVGSCVDFIVDENIWKKSKMTIEAESLGINGTRESLIRQIEHSGLEDSLVREVGKVWAEIEESLKLNRKPKYL